MSMPPYQPPPQMPYAQPNPDEITSNDKLWAALSYIFSPLVPIIALVMDNTKNRTFVKYHAVQALGFGVALYIIAFIFNLILTTIFLNTLTLGNVGFYGILSCFLSLIWIIPLGLAIYMAIQAYNGKYFSIPIITDFLAKQKWLQKQAP